MLTRIFVGQCRDGHWRDVRRSKLGAAALCGIVCWLNRGGNAPVYVAVVSTGDDIGSSILTVVAPHDLGVPADLW